jgi:hypothetical protein
VVDNVHAKIVDQLSEYWTARQTDADAVRALPSMPARRFSSTFFASDVVVDRVTGLEGSVIGGRSENIRLPIAGRDDR